MFKKSFLIKIYEKKAFIINLEWKLENPLKKINACFIIFPIIIHKFSNGIYWKKNEN